MSYAAHNVIPGQPGLLARAAQRQQAIAAQQAALMARAGHGAVVTAGPPQGTIWISNPTSAAAFTITTGSIFTSGTATTASNVVWYNSSDQDIIDAATLDSPAEIRDGQAFKLKLPDGAVLDVRADGSYEMIDRDARVIYRAARIREFNRFINASDRLEEFIAYCGQNGVRAGEMLEIPLKLFIGWLVVEAARADNEPPPQVEILAGLHKMRTPRCLACGQHLKKALREHDIEFCGPACFNSHYRKLTAPQPLLLLPPPKVQKELEYV